MMNRQKYLQELKEKIRLLPMSERESALRYCEEYFDEAGEDNFQQAMLDLGTPSQFAQQTIQNSTNRHHAGETQERTEHQKNKNFIWLIPMIILASPVIICLIPVAIILFFIALFIICLPFLILLFLLLLFFSLSMALVVMAFRFVFIEISSALLLLGGALILGALFLIALTGLIQFVKVVFPWIALKVTDVWLNWKERRGTHSDEI